MPTARRRPAARSFDYRPLLRRAGMLLAVSFGLSLLLMAYLFGFTEGFFGRLLGSTLVLFTLLAVTFLAVVPFVNWAADNWFGRTWAEHPTPQPTRRARPAAPAARSAQPRSSSGKKPS